MATPVSTCCTPQLKDRQLNSVFSHRITSFQERLWYSVWIREGVIGISRRGTERLLTQSQPLCTVYSIAFPPEQRGVSCISDEFWSQLLPDIDATVHRSVLQLMQCICWSERLLSQNCYVRLYKRGSEWMRKQVEILSSDCLSCTAAQLLPEQFPVKIASIRNSVSIWGCQQWMGGCREDKLEISKVFFSKCRTEVKSATRTQKIKLWIKSIKWWSVNRNQN